MAKSKIIKLKRKQAYLLRVELEHIKPAIWRQVWVEGQMTLDQLHQVIQLAVGWTDSHLHEFTIKGVTYATPHPDDDLGRKITDERVVRLRTVLEPGLEFDYVYDFGDNWRHIVRVEKTEITGESRGVHVEDGARACPPEDCGGPHIYGEFLDNLKTNPRGQEVKDFLRWAGEDFDPERFDLRAANAALLHLT